jgi:flagellar basal body-associated protein FliL
MTKVDDFSIVARRTWCALPLAAGLMVACAASLPATRAYAAAAPAAAEHAGPAFLAVDDIVVPVGAHGRLAGYVMIKASLEFADATQLKAVEPLMPRIVDAWLRTVHGLSQRGHFDAASVNPDMLKQQLLEATKTALNGTVPDAVLITRAILTRTN